MKIIKNLLVVGLAILFLPMAPEKYHEPLKSQKELRKEYMLKINNLIHRQDYGGAIRLLNYGSKETNLPVYQIYRKIEKELKISHKNDLERLKRNYRDNLNDLEEIIINQLKK